MKNAAVIPARMQSVRLPGKCLLDLGGKPIIQRVVENVQTMPFFDQVFVVTDSEDIGSVCEKTGATVLFSRQSHSSGTSRIAEVIEQIDAEIIVNVQGDEPFINSRLVEDCINALAENPDLTIATPVYPSQDAKLALDSDRVKAVLDAKDRALYFSRYPVPYQRESIGETTWYIHMGLYSYRRSFLQNYSDLLPCTLEASEKLEQLRFLYNGFTIQCIKTDQLTLGIDTDTDLQEARAILQNQSG